MDEQTRKKIIKDYLDGKGSTTIEKEIKFSKPTILKILHSENLIRKNERCKKINIKKFDDKYIIYRKCPSCGEDIKVSSNNHSITCRNYYNSINTNCKKCSLKLQIGEGNPFYGKKHSQKSLEKMTKTLTSTPIKFSSSSKPEKKIEDILINLNYDVKRTYRIGQYICDIFIEKLNLIIEYNGDYWHCNPKKYKFDYFHPHKKN